MFGILIQLIVSGIAMGFIYALVGIEYTLIWNASGVLNFSHDKMITTGAYIFGGTYILGLGMDFIPGILLSLITVALLGIVVARVIFIPLRNMTMIYTIMATVMLGKIIVEAIRLLWGPVPFSVPGFLIGTVEVAALVVGFLIGRGLGYPSLKMKGVYLSLTTLAFSEIIRILATNLMDITGGTQGIKNIPRFRVLFWNLDTNVKYFYFVWTVAVLLCLLSMRIAHSKWGREFKAVKDNAEAIESLGLDIKKIKIRAFTLAAVYGALGGALYAHFNQFVTSLSFTTDLSISYVIMLMIGGIGNIPGNMIGAIVITILPEMLRFLGDYYQITFCTMVLLCAVFLPNGLVSLPGRFRHLVKKTGKPANKKSSTF